MALMGGSYNAVRPDLFLDPANGRLHLVASSLDDAPYVYYRASSDQGLTWDPLRQVNPSTSTTASNTRYATVHANGPNIYIAARTVGKSLFTVYYLHTVRSTDGGQTWFDQTKISSYTALLTGEYGVSLAGVGDRLYMGYRVGGGRARRYDGAGWSNYQQLKRRLWPSITQAEDGQAWLTWENGDDLIDAPLHRFRLEAAEMLHDGNAPTSRSYPNLKLGTSASRVEWVSTSCNGASSMVVDGRTISSGPGRLPTNTSTNQNADIHSDLHVDVYAHTDCYFYTDGHTYAHFYSDALPRRRQPPHSNTHTLRQPCSWLYARRRSGQGLASLQPALA
jgi:hypothetical protein